MTSARSMIYNVLYTAKELCCLCYSEVGNDFIRIQDEVFFPEMQYIRTIEFQEVVAYILGNETADLMLPSEAVCKQCTQSCIQSYIFIRRCKRNYKTMPDMLQKFLSNVDSFTLGYYKSVGFAVDVHEGVTNVCYCYRKRISNKETLLKKLEHAIMKKKDNSLYLSDEDEVSTESDEQETPVTEAKDKKTASENSSGASEKPAGEKAKPVSETTLHIKKPLNAFMLYLKEMRPKVVEELSGKESSAINQILGSRWHSLSAEEQEKYNEKARLERQLHKQKYPDWHPRINYSNRAKQRKKEIRRSANLKKCRAVYGFHQQNQWCKSCRRKKRCTRDNEALAAASGAMPMPMATPKFGKDIKLEETSDASSVEDTDLPQDYLRWFINDL